MAGEPSAQVGEGGPGTQGAPSHEEGIYHPSAREEKRKVTIRVENISYNSSPLSNNSAIMHRDSQLLTVL